MAARAVGENQHAHDNCVWNHAGGAFGMPQFIHEPAVPPMPAPAPAPSGFGDKGHGTAYLAVYCSLLALAAAPAPPGGGSLFGFGLALEEGPSAGSS